jgi:sugar lactone lactonase YvrE
MALSGPFRLGAATTNCLGLPEAYAALRWRGAFEPGASKLFKTDSGSLTPVHIPTRDNMRGVRSISLLTACVATAACAPADDSGSARGASVDSANRGGGAAGGGRVQPLANATAAGFTQGLQTPEAVRYDADLDVFFVANINGNPARKDNNGWIGRVNAAQPGRAEIFVAGGQDGVFLHAPKGMVLQGDTLWVTDIDIVRGFDKRTGKFVAAVGFWSKNVGFLNDIALGSDGALYITDTGITFDESGAMKPSAGGDRVYRLAGRTMTEEVRGDLLGHPNGIAFDSVNTRFILAPFNGKDVQTWRPGALPAPLATGPGMYDGVEIVNGRVFVTSWADSAVHVIENGAMRKYIANLPSPADLGFDTRRRVLAVPRFNDGRVDYFKLP